MRLQKKLVIGLIIAIYILNIKLLFFPPIPLCKRMPTNGIVVFCNGNKCPYGIFYEEKESLWFFQPQLIFKKLTEEAKRRYFNALRNYYGKPPKGIYQITGHLYKFNKNYIDLPILGSSKIESIRGDSLSTFTKFCKELRKEKFRRFTSFWKIPYFSIISILTIGLIIFLSKKTSTLTLWISFLIYILFTFILLILITISTLVNILLLLIFIILIIFLIIKTIKKIIIAKYPQLTSFNQ